LPARRPVTARLLVGLLLIGFSFAAAGGPVTAADPAPRPASAFQPTPQRRGGDVSGRLRGRLAGLVKSVQAGTVDRRAFLGLETAQAPLGEGVAVSLHLADLGGEEALRLLVASGARVVNRSGSDVEAYLPGPALRSLGTLTGIDRAAPIIRPVPMGAPGIGALGEGVALHKADQWQAAGITGSGIKVGIIDGGFVGLTSRLGRELPASVHARCYREIGLYSSTARSCEAYSEHGTAVAETIADMAPGVSLYLADPVSMQDLESTVAWMTSNGVKIINVSLGFAYDGPGDSTSPPGSVYSVVNQAVKGGALWVNAAGNAGEDGWSGTWKDANANSLLDVSGTDESNSIALAAGESVLVTLRWNDTWGKSANDYDLYVFGNSGSIPVGASEDPQNGTGDPVESVGFTPATSGLYRIVIQRAGGSAASKLQLLVLTSQDSPLQHRSEAGTLPSPADSANPGMISVGAVSFDAPDVIETYSSRGPTTDDRIKPDLVAADCTTTSLVNPFCGTSESAPYAAGAAALVLSSRPTLTPAQLATWLRTHAVPLGGTTPNSTFGWGRLDLGAPPAPPAPTTIAFAAQPPLAAVLAPFNPAPAVRILDQDRVPLTTGPGSTLSVTLALGANPAGATLDCQGGLTKDAVAGVAIFSGCTISAEGPGYTLVATAAGLPPIISAPFDVLAVGSAPPPQILVSASAAAVAWSSPVTLAGQLAPAQGGLPSASLAGRTVTFEMSRNGALWSSVGQAVTDASGLATLSYRPVTNLYYRATFAGAADLGAATGGVVRVTVRQTVTMRPTNNGLTRTSLRSQSITFTARVRPARSDVPAGAVTFEVYHLVGSTWQLTTRQTAQPDATGLASAVLRFSGPGTWSVRSMARPTALNANSFWTPAERYVVR
jgi:hypothetical protein